METVPTDAGRDDNQIVAVIAAALMAFQNGEKKYVIKSIRRVGERSAWAEAGRREILQ